MAGKTTNYGWTKPEANDWLDVDVISEVFGQIDEQMKAVEEAAGKSKELENHVTDKNNPHEVTAKQVGAVPNHREVIVVTDLNDLTEEGLYTCTTASGTAENIPTPSYAFSLLVENHGGWNGLPVQTFTDYVGGNPTYKRSAYWTESDGVLWTPWAMVYTDYTIVAGETPLTAGTSSLKEGYIYLQYE